MDGNSRKSVYCDFCAAKVADNLDPMCSGLCKLVLEQRLERCGSTSIPPRVDSCDPWLAVDVDLDDPVGGTLVPDKPDIRA